MILQELAKQLLSEQNVYPVLDSIKTEIVHIWEQSEMFSQPRVEVLVLIEQAVMSLAKDESDPFKHNQLQFVANSISLFSREKINPDDAELCRSNFLDVGFVVAKK